MPRVPFAGLPPDCASLHPGYQSSHSKQLYEHSFEAAVDAPPEAAVVKSQTTGLFAMDGGSMAVLVQPKQAAGMASRWVWDAALTDERKNKNQRPPR